MIVDEAEYLPFSKHAVYVLWVSSLIIYIRKKEETK